MNAKEAAARLDKSQYGNEGDDGLFREMKENRLVAVFGYSDDCMEMRGAVNDEFGMGPVHLDADGAIQNECEHDDCPYFERLIAKAPRVEAISDTDGYAFVYRTDIPHETFEVFEEEDRYCRGIVFSLDQLTP